MNKFLENKDFSRVAGLEVRDSNRKVNSVDSNSACPHMIDSGKHKVGCQQESINLQNKHNSICPLPLPKDTYPREPVSVDFAVDQWFRILLVHMQKQGVSILEDSSVPFEAKSWKINI